MKTEIVTSLKRKATDIITEVTQSRAPVLITQHGKPAAYLVDVETFECLNQKLEILEGIARGERAIEEGAADRSSFSTQPSGSGSIASSGQ